MKKKVRILSLHLILCLVITGLPIKVYALSKSSAVNSYASSSEFSVYLPKSLQFDKSTKTADYQVSVEGTLADGSALHVTPDESFILKQPGKHGIVATVQQDKTIFAAEEVNAAKKGLQTAGVITATDLSAGQWYGSFNFNVEFIKGPEKVLLTENAYDTEPIPDQYNTGCDETEKIKFLDWRKIEDTGLNWRGDNILDFHNCLKNITEENANILIENVDFTDVLGIQLLYPQGFDKDFPVRITFKNCKMYSWFSAYSFDDTADILFTFEDCTIYRVYGGNVSLKNCKLGGATQFRSDNLASWRNLTNSSSFYGTSSAIAVTKNFKAENCYIYDTVDDLSDTEENKNGKAMGVQVQNTSNISFVHCRIETPQVPFTYRNGDSYAALYFSGGLSNITVKDCMVNCGYEAYTRITDGTNLVFDNCKTPKAYYRAEHYAVPKVDVWNWSIIDNMYVSSVLNDNSDIKVHVTNETSSDRELRIVTNLGVTKVIVPKFVQGDDLQGEPSFKATNVDYEVKVPSEGVEWIACFDGNKQLRFMNYSDKDAYVNENWLTD